MVLDTNAALALWYFEDPALSPLAAALASGRLVTVATPPMIAEWHCVLAREGFDPQRAAAARTAYAALRRELPLPELEAPARCRDPDDQKFLVCALAYAPLLLTRDKALLRLARHRRIAPRLAILRPEQAMPLRGPVAATEIS